MTQVDVKHLNINQVFKYKSSILEITENCKDIYRKVSVPSLTP